MIFKHYYLPLVLLVALLFVALTAASFSLVKQWYLPFGIAVPVIAYLAVLLFRLQNRTQIEWTHFIEAIQYRDFSRHFDEKTAPPHLKFLRKGFNEINDAFKNISREKETQYQYLQQVLELVNTGILSYQMDTGEVVWMNDTLKKMLQVPYLKTIHSLQRRDTQLFEDIFSLKSGDTKISIAHLPQNTFKILLSATAFVTDGRQSKLIAFQNIEEALDKTESKAWQKLLSVMTHEIMNSIAPIASLAETLKSRLAEADSSVPEDLEVGIETIRRRSEGLLRFAQTYRNLNKITTLNLQHIFVRELFGGLHQLMQPTLEQRGIELEIILRDINVALQVDPSLLEQVLINLLLNAIEAVKDSPEPKIVLSAVQEGAKIVLKVGDNGIGMPEEILDKIFIPFFSTRKNGSGIGLSLCKQIILLHKGTIQVQSQVGKGSIIMLQMDKNP